MVETVVPKAVSAIRTRMKITGCANMRSLWTIRSSEQFCTNFSSNLRKQDGSKHQSQSPKCFDSTLKIFADRVSSNRTEHASGEGSVHAFSICVAQIQAPILQPLNPCPVCGAETTLAEIEPHPLHANFEIHGYLCDRCGPIKSLVVLRGPPLQPMM